MKFCGLLRRITELLKVKSLEIYYYCLRGGSCVYKRIYMERYKSSSRIPYSQILLIVSCECSRCKVVLWNLVFFELKCILSYYNRLY